MKNSYTPDEKLEIAQRTRTITRERAMADYREIAGARHRPCSRVGMVFVDYYTFPYRLDTGCREKYASFYDLFAHRDEMCKFPHIAKFHAKIKARYPHYTEEMQWYSVYSVYCGTINAFKPVLAMELYIKYRPSAVLDFTMGWGGRLAGAAAIDVPHYIGIDLNSSLREPYSRMLSDLSALGSKTKATLIFKSALDVDYSKLRYDMVLTSPPYYNCEIYPGSTPMTRKEWVVTFYRPLFELTMRHLQPGGHYLLNVSSEVYTKVCVPLFGEAHESIRLNKRARPEAFSKEEYVYAWRKQPPAAAAIATKPLSKNSLQ